MLENFTGTLLKTRAAQEIDSASLSVSTHESDAKSQAVFASYLDSAVRNSTHSKSSVLYCARKIGAQLSVENDMILSAGLQQKLNEKLFAQAGLTSLQASIALCGAYGSPKGVQTLGSPGFFSYILNKSLSSKKGKKLTGKAAKSTLAASKPKTAKTSGAKTSGKKKNAKKK